MNSIESMFDSVLNRMLFSKSGELSEIIIYKWATGGTVGKETLNWFQMYRSQAMVILVKEKDTPVKVRCSKPPSFERATHKQIFSLTMMVITRDRYICNQLNINFPSFLM